MFMNMKYVLVIWKDAIYVHTLHSSGFSNNLEKISTTLLMLCLSRSELTGKLWAVSPGTTHIHNVEHDFVLLPSTNVAGWIWNGGQAGGEAYGSLCLCNVTLL